LPVILESLPDLRTALTSCCDKELAELFDALLENDDRPLSATVAGRSR
jgi:hypothetical protein